MQPGLESKPTSRGSLGSLASSLVSHLRSRFKALTGLQDFHFRLALSWQACDKRERQVLYYNGTDEEDVWLQVAGLFVSSAVCKHLFGSCLPSFGISLNDEFALDTWQ
jgi:hypothetical protein